MYPPSPTLSPRRTPVRPASQAKWPVDPTYSRDSWAPGAPRESPFRDGDPAHFWKPFGTNKVGYEELDAAVFSDRLELIEKAKRDNIPTRPRSRFRERETFAEKHRERYRALSKAEDQHDGGAVDDHGESVRASNENGNQVLDGAGSTSAPDSESVPAIVQPHKVSIVLRLGGSQPNPVEERVKGYGEQFFSRVITGGVSSKDRPSHAPPANQQQQPDDSRGALLRRSISAVTGSLMCDVTVDCLMDEQTGEQVDPSQGVVATPRSAVVQAMTEAPALAAASQPSPSVQQQDERVPEEWLTPGHDWRRFSGDPRVLGQQQQQQPQRQSVGVHAGNPVVYTPGNFDILSRLQELDRAKDAPELLEPPFLTTVGVWVPSLAAAKVVAAKLRDSAASGELQQSFFARGLDAKVELLEIQHDEEPARAPTPPPPPDPEPSEHSDDESVRVAQVRKAELLYRLFSTGRGFRRLLFSSFLQNSLEHVPEQRVVHVTEGPYMHSTFLLREPLWAGMSMRLALVALMQPCEDEALGGDASFGDRGTSSPNPYDIRAPPQDFDPVWPLWILPNAAALARKGLLREALEVAERELATNVAMDGTEGRGTDAHFDTTAAVFERLVLLQNIAALDLITRCPRSSDALHVLLRAEVLTRPRDPASGGSPCCSCHTAFSLASGHRVRCNRGLLRLATLTNLAAYYRRKGLLNAAHQYMYRAVKLCLRRRTPENGADEYEEGAASESAVCLSVPPECRAAARINQGALLIMMRSYEEGLKCSSAALSRLQEEWAKGRLSLRDPLVDTGTRRSASGRKGLRGLVSESMAMVTEIAICMYNAGVCHEQLYRAPAALQAYLRTQAVLSLMPRQHPTAGALQQLLGPEHLLREQMADLSRSRSARVPAGAHARPWRSCTANTNDTTALVNATWDADGNGAQDEDGDAAGDGRARGQRIGESEVLDDFSSFLEEGEQHGTRRSPAGGAKQRQWETSLSLMAHLEPGAGRRSDGGPRRSWPANRSPGYASAGGALNDAFPMYSTPRRGGIAGGAGERPSTATGTVGAQGPMASVAGTPAPTIGVHPSQSPGWTLLSPQRPRTSGGERGATHLAGGLRSQLRDELASPPCSALGNRSVKVQEEDEDSNSAAHTSLHNDALHTDEHVFWGGVSKSSQSVVPVVLHRKLRESAGRPRRDRGWRQGEPVSVSVHSWSCYDGTASADHATATASRATASRLDSEVSSPGAGRGHQVLGEVLAQRPVTAPEGAVRTNRVLAFASPMQQEGGSPRQQHNLTSEARKPAQRGAKRLPSAPAVRVHSATSGPGPMQGVEWEPPAGAEALFARMQTHRAPVQLGNLDFASLSSPVIRASGHQNQSQPDVWSSPSAAEAIGVHAGDIRRHPWPHRQPHPPWSESARGTEPHLTTPAGQRAKWWPAPASGSRGKERVRPKTAFTPRHHFLDQAREIVKEKERHREKEDSRDRRTAQSRDIQPPARTATATGAASKASGGTSIQTASRGRGVLQGQSQGTEATARRGALTARSPGRPKTAAVSPKTARLARERAFPAPAHLTETDALVRHRGNNGGSAATRRAKQDAGVGPVAAETMTLPHSHSPARPTPQAQAPPAQPAQKSDAGPDSSATQTALVSSGRRVPAASKPSSATMPPPPPPPPPPLYRMLDQDASRVLGREAGIARAAGTAISAARARIKGGDVVDLDEMDKLRLQKRRATEAADSNQLAQAEAQQEYSRTKASIAALAIQGAVRSRRAREALRWRYWHALACLIQRALRSRWSRRTLRLLQHQKRLREHSSPFPSSPGQAPLAISLPPAPALVHAAVPGVAARDVSRDVTEMGSAARREKVKAESEGAAAGEEVISMGMVDPTELEREKSLDEDQGEPASDEDGALIARCQAQLSTSSVSDSQYLALLLPDICVASGESVSAGVEGENGQGFALGGSDNAGAGDGAHGDWVEEERGGERSEMTQLHLASGE